MSNWIRWIVAFIAAITIPLITVGCREVNPTQTQAIVSKDSFGKTDASARIPGHTWGQVSLMECSPSAECKPSEGLKPILLFFNKDGTIIATPETVPITYVIAGSSLTLSTDDGRSLTFTIKDLTSKSFTLVQFVHAGSKKGYFYLHEFKLGD